MPALTADAGDARSGDQGGMMPAARWYGIRDVRVEQVRQPVCGDGEALVQVEWVGLCGSDVEEYVEGPVVAVPPVILGHEIVGVVRQPAADGTGPDTGTRVVVDVVTGCGHCFWCRRHDEGLCPELLVTGQHVDGGLAQYVVGRAERLVVVPSHLDPRVAALAEPLAVAVRALRKAGSLIGRGVLIVGGGTIGMLCAQVARAAAASTVVVVEPGVHRRELIGSWGVDTVWAPSPHSRAQEVAARFPARGVDVVVECAGRAGLAAEAASLVRRGGMVVLTGVVPPPEPMDTLDLVLGEKTVVGSAAHMWDDDVAVAIQLLASGAVDIGSMITHEVPLAEIGRAFEIMTDPTKEAVKLLVSVRGSA